MAAVLTRLAARPGHRMRIVLAGLLVVMPAASCAQLQRLQNQGGMTSTPTKLSGRVLNAVSGAPIGRVLVTFNSRGMLTDQEGRFEFDQVMDNAGSFQLIKPGYFTSPDPMDQPNLYYQVNQITGPLEFRLYPEAILAGNLTAPTGEPLARVSVMVRRSVFDDQGHRWMQAGQALTDMHGAFRIPVSAGDYRIETSYALRGTGIGVGSGDGEAVLPVLIPAPAPGAAAQVLHVRSGEEQRFDLRPNVRRTFPVALSMEGAPERGFPSIMVRSSDGTSFNTGITRSRTAGRGMLFLPTGTYKLTARLQTQEASEIAETSVTVTGAEHLDPDSPGTSATGAVLRFVSIPSIPVELSIDPASTSDNQSQGAVGSGFSSFPPKTNGQPTPMQFGLSLMRTDPDELDEEGGKPNIPLQPLRNGNGNGTNGAFAFTAPPGTYRLVSRGLNSWYIKSASFGTSDLLTQGLSVTAGGGSAPIRLVVSNQTGTLQSVGLLKGGPARSCWIYLVASYASTNPVSVFNCATNGSFLSYFVPPGSYQAIAFERRRSIDFTDPASLTPYSSYVQSVTITPGTPTKVSLNVVPQAEERP